MGSRHSKTNGGEKTRIMAKYLYERGSIPEEKGTTHPEEHRSPPHAALGTGNQEKKVKVSSRL